MGSGSGSGSGSGLGSACDVVRARVDLRDDQVAVIGQLARHCLVDRRELPTVAAVGRVELHEHVLVGVGDRGRIRRAHELHHRARGGGHGLAAVVRRGTAALHAAHEGDQARLIEGAAVRILGRVVEHECEGDGRREATLGLHVEELPHLEVLGRLYQREDGLAPQRLGRGGDALELGPRAVVEEEHVQADTAREERVLHLG